MAGGAEKSGRFLSTRPAWVGLRPLVPEHAAARGPGPPGLGARGVPPQKDQRHPKGGTSTGPKDNVFRYRAHRGRYRPPCCGRRASDLGRHVPLRSKGLSAAPQRRGAA